MKKFFFSKKVAAGNDFILVDNRRGILTQGAKAARKFCDRKLSIGADGLIFLERSKKADFRMRIFNPDGSQAEMCGNGVRCLAKFALEQKISGRKQTIETLAGTIQAQVSPKLVRARMVKPSGLRLDVPVIVSGTTHRLHLVNTGVPHAVEITESLSQTEVDRLGSLLRRHEFFAPKGTNVNFVSIGTGNEIEIRTYERGVEAETLACGTGSTAGALVAAELKGLKSPVKVKTLGGEILKIYFSKKNGSFDDVYLEGKVADSFEGRVSW